MSNHELTEEEENRLLQLEDKWNSLLNERGVENLIDRLILADLFEAYKDSSSCIIE